MSMSSKILQNFWDNSFFGLLFLREIRNIKTRAIMVKYIKTTLIQPILGDPGAVSRVGRKGATKVFKYGRKHPRRPRDSQSGREKRRDESFQVRAKEPLGTDSHLASSKNSSGWRLLIGHKKMLCIIVSNLFVS